MFGDGKFQRLQTSCINIQVFVFGITDVEQFSARSKSGREFFDNGRLNLIVGSWREIILIPLDNQWNAVQVTLCCIFLT